MGKKVKIAWSYVSGIGASIFYPPCLLSSLTRTDDRGIKNGVATCPAVLQYEQRVLVVRSPYTFKIRCDRKNERFLFQPVYPFTQVNEGSIRKLIKFEPTTSWRGKDIPLLQLTLPYVFFSDVPVYINQVDPTNTKSSKNWALVQGRFNIYDWHRPINWSVEWVETTNDLIVRRGDPLFQLIFETNSPESSVEFIYQDMTDKLRKSVDASTGVTQLVKGTFNISKEHGLKRKGKLIE
jgi:hypothetical protein